MRQSRATGPPSTQSGSSSSGRGLVRGSSRRVSGIPGVMVPGEPEKGPSKNRTKVIIILGIALPVLACIIGIIAWSVTTDVLRISPRSHDNAFNRFGHQGKTRIDTLQPRNDDLDIDIFQFHSITSPPSTVPSVLIKVITQNSQPKQSNKPTRPTTLVEKTTTEIPNVSDILSRLISDMPVPKNPKNFVVFAPVADALTASGKTKDRKFDGKALVHEEEDLVAEESSYYEEVSQDLPDRKIPFSRKRKSSVEGSHPSKSARILLSDNRKDLQEKKQGLQARPNVGAHSLWEGNALKGNSPINQQKPVNGEIPLPTNKYTSSSSTNKNIGFQQNRRPNMPQNSNAEFLQTRGMKSQQIQMKGNTNIGSQTAHLEMSPHLNDIKKNSRNQALPNNPPPNPNPLRIEDKSGFNRNGNNFFQTDGRSALQQQVSYQNQHPLGQSQGKQTFKGTSPQGHTTSQNYQQQQVHNALQQIHNPQQQVHNPQQQVHNALQQIHSSQQQVHSPQQQVHSPQQQLHNSQQQFHNPQHQVHNPQQQVHNSQQQIPDSHQKVLNTIQKIIFGDQPQNPSPQQVQNSPSQKTQNMPSQQILNQHYFQATSDNAHNPSSHTSLNQGPSRSTYNNNPEFPGGSYPIDNGYQSSNNEPKYYAPPPQTFHTKTSYDRPQNNHEHVPSISTYEKAAQIAVDKSKEELHLHHHHHHHHDQMTSNSDPIGDINLSDVNKNNDADRLGTIGLGLGGPRGITVQIGGGGGGGGGGGITGLLPLGALGIAKNIVASLLPRPTLGLNSKVFLGVEVGRGGGVASLLG